MKRIVEKVKDIVEVCPFTHLHDFAADPALTLAGYHFTDITTDLMAKWIDRVASVKSEQGAASALAGFRGVGKSHFLAVVAAIVSRPELRSRINDAHVASCADRLSRRHGTVAFVRRGSGNSLLEELKNSISVILGVSSDTLSDSLHDLLLKASEHSGESPLVLLIDTATGRESRVARDDGIFLTEIAEAARMHGVFVGVALDDDISGADGPNSSIAGSFKIDYLDQEHLYKIVDTHIFSKHYQKLPVLHDIYEYYRSALPGFRWSEQRFSSLYPLHPATLEIAPLIRLYVHDFALLGFASEAGVKILGRPANSLIGLDEVFDGVEKKLRFVPDLKDAFTTFDQLEREVVAKMTVQQRLPAKLILKGLLMLSLNGQGSTAAEIAASMMIFDDAESGSATLDVDKLLDSFAFALPGSIVKFDRDNAEAKYCFKLAAKEDVSSLLTEAGKDISDETVWNVLQRQTAEKFSDIDMSAEFGTHPTSCSVEWRGAIRRGEIIWNLSDSPDQSREGKDLLDWKIVAEPRNSDLGANQNAEVCHSLAWKLAELTTDEKDTIRRHHLLQTNTKIREQFGDGIATAAHVHSIAVEKIWQRVFLQDGKLTAGEVEYRFSEDTGAAHSLAQLFTDTLAPVFESQYPSHPKFSQVFGMKQASSLIASFFSGSASSNADAQELAKTFAFPLGLAVKHGETYVPASSEELFNLEIVNAVFGGKDTDSAMSPLTDISTRMQKGPFGLTRETQHSILAALVSQRYFEFVTSSGNRINHRSLDLQIIWDDIVGVAKPLSELYSPERLLSWAKLITGNSAIGSLERSEDRLLIIDSLSGWLTGWRENRILDEFDALPDESLNAAIWRTAANLQKSFGAMADNIDALVKNDQSLDQCIQFIADLFSDSEAEFEKKKNDLRVLKDFTSGVALRAEVTAYLSLCEMTDDDEVENSRQALLGLIGTDHFAAAAADNDRFKKLWSDFKAQYLDYYVEKHDALMNSLAYGQALNDVVRSDLWSAFESYSAISWFDQRYVSKARELVRELRHLSCDSNVRESLGSKPFCSCSFRLSEYDRLIGLPTVLQTVVNNGLDAFRARLTDDSEKLIASAESDAMAASLKQILAGFVDAETYPHLTSQEVRLLKIAVEREFDVSFDEMSQKGKIVDDLSELLPKDAHLWQQEIESLEIFTNSER